MVKALDGGFVCWETILGPDLAKAFSEGGDATKDNLDGEEKGGKPQLASVAERRRRREGISRKKNFSVSIAFC